ncbi:MAG: hypothetical protein U1E56_01430 [Bauldia sp.]
MAFGRSFAAVGRFFGCVVGAALAAALLAASSPASAEGPAEPIVAIGSRDIDPAKYEWLSETARRVLKESIEEMQDGKNAGFVFAAAFGTDSWAARFVVKPNEPYSIADLARQALQACEFYTTVACAIVSINGKEVRLADGSLPLQPRLLVAPAAAFDADQIPFLSRADQALLRAYGRETKPKALIITPTQFWLWRTGDTVFAAIDQAAADCQANPGARCILYAVNDRVVFQPGAAN